MTSTQDREMAEDRGEHLRSIMADAVENTRARHPNCRGPFKINFPEDHIRLPIAAITADGIKPLSKTIVEIEDELARNAVEKISDRPAKTSRYGRSG